MPPPNADFAANSWPRFWHSPSVRAGIIAALTALLAVPLLMVYGVVNERSSLAKSALHDIQKHWGREQTLTGPVMVVPYTEHITQFDTVKDSEGNNQVVTKDIFNDHQAVILPETLNIAADLAAKTKNRGIYQALVYKTELNIKAQFDHSKLLEKGEGKRTIRWDDAYVIFGFTDTKAIEATEALTWNGSKSQLQPGSPFNQVISHGIHARLDKTASNQTEHEMTLKLTLRGSEGLYFTPAGKETRAKFSSPWQHPSFQGDFLPKDHKISQQGFTADWQIPHLARNFPQFWLIGDKNAKHYRLGENRAGVVLYDSNSLYQRIDRSVKYGVLFVLLTFVCFFGLELWRGLRLHTLQYALIGSALVLFFLILLALSEHYRFLHAYIAASVCAVFLIVLYGRAVTKSWIFTLLLLMLMGGLYTMLYFVLQMEDYAMLAGTGLLTLVLAAMMWVTRNIHRQSAPWHEGNTGNPVEQEVVAYVASRPEA